MYRAAAWLKATGHNVTWVDGALPVFVPGFRKGKTRLKEAVPGAPIIREVRCGNNESEHQMTKHLRYYGKPYPLIKKEMSSAPHPDEVWIGTGLTYHYETTWDLVQMAKDLFPGVRVRVGGIYATLCPDHARASGGDVWTGEIPEAQAYWPDYSIVPYVTPQRTIKMSKGCLRPVEPVLTDHGYVPIRDIQIGDRVFSRGEFRKVTVPQVREYDGEMVRIWTELGSGISTEITANHRVETARGIVPAGELQIGDEVYLSKPAEPQAEIVSDRVVDLPSNEPKDWFYYCAGWYLGDGSLAWGNHTDKYRRDLRFACGIRQEDAEKLAERLGHGAKVRQRSTGYWDVIAYGHPYIERFERLFGHGSKAKYIGGEILNLCDLKRQGLIDLLRGYWEADGHVRVGRPHTVSALTASKSLAMGIALALLRLGYHPRVHKATNPKSEDPHFNVVLAKRAEAIHFCIYVLERPDLAEQFPPVKWTLPGYSADQNGLIKLSITKIEKTHYKGPVHNLEVEGVHKYTCGFEVENCTVTKACSFCFLPGEQILTSTGYKAIEDIKVGDLAYSEGGWHQVYDELSRKYEGDIVTIETDTGSVTVTADHRVPTRNGTKKAGELTTEDQVYVSLPVERAEPQNLGPYTLSESLAWLVGLYVAEGCPTRSRGKISGSAFTLGRTETSLMLKLSLASREVLGLETSVSDTGTAIQTKIYSSSIGQLLAEECGTGAANKRVPACLLTAEAAIVRSFLRGLWDGDGSLFKTRQGYWRASLSTTSHTLAMEVFILLSRLGFDPIISKPRMPKDSVAPDGHTIRARHVSYQVLITRQHDVAKFADQILNQPIVARVHKMTDTEIEDIQAAASMSGNVSKFCRRIGMSEGSFYNLTRYKKRRDQLAARSREPGKVWLAIRKLTVRHYSGMVYNCSVHPTHTVTANFNIFQCAVKTFEPKFDFSQPQSLEEYVEREMHKGVRVVRIWASQLLQPPQVFAETMDRLYLLQVKHGVRIRIFASEGIQPSLFTPKMAFRMVRAGFSHITIPMESVNPDTLKAYNKPSGLSDYHRSVHLAKEAGFSWIGAFIMTGTPQQNLSDLVQAVVDCWYRRISPVIMKYTMIPGTEDWDNPDYQWIHKGKDLVDLHGSLWPAARPDLTALDLEEVSAIAAVGYDFWSKLPQTNEPYFTGYHGKTNSRVNQLFMEWCERYGLIKGGRFRSLSTATPHEPCRGVEEVSPSTVGASVGHASVSLVV